MVWALTELMLGGSNSAEAWITWAREAAQGAPAPIYDAPDPLPWRHGLGARAQMNPLTKLYIEQRAQSLRAIEGVSTCSWCNGPILAGEVSRTDGWTHFHLRCVAS
jgi:hypothetical protein